MSGRRLPRAVPGEGARASARAAVRAAVVLLAALSAGGCIVLTDHSGVALSDAQVASIEAGVTTRDEALQRLGPPTGVYSTSLRAIVTGAGAPIAAPAAAPRLDEDVLTWQAVDVDARVAFFPVLFAWVGGRVTDRTLTLFFDERGVVRYVAWREGER